MSESLEWHDSLADLCRRAVDHNHRLRELMAPLKPATLREHFVLASVHLALEHHSAVIRCMSGGEYGSAAALLRPLLEAGAAAFWFVYAAPVEKLASLSTTTEDAPLNDLPDLKPMIEAIEPHFPAVRTLVDGFKAGGSAKWLHKYTHGGTPQLARRGAGGWRPEEIRLNLMRADMFAGMASSVGTHLTTNPQLGLYIFPTRDAMGVELREHYAGDPIPQEPHALPAAPLLKQGGGPPP